MELLVPDASVILKWFLADPPHAKIASLVRDGYIQGVHRLLIPEYAYYEVANVLTHPKTRYGYQQAKRTLAAFRKLRIPSVRFKMRKLNRALDLTYMHNLKASYYDALYLAVAEKYGGKWITADWKAFRRLRKLDYVEWIGYWLPANEIHPIKLL